MSSTKNIWLHLRGEPPWGFRLRGGKGTGLSLVISRVNSKGRQQGLKEGDRVLSVNGQSTGDMTHADAQRVIRDSGDGLELHLERTISIPGTNGIHPVENGQQTQDEGIISQLNALDEYMSQIDVGSWSTDSTSTGSTTIHVSSLNSDEPSNSDNVWSPNTRKKANLHLNCDLHTSSETSASASQADTTKESAAQIEETSPVWQPFGAPCDVQFRPVKLEVPRTKMTTTAQQSDVPKKTESETAEAKTESPKPTSSEREKQERPSSVTNGVTSPKSPDLNSAPTTFTKSGWSSHLPPSQSPTITLLQKAREGQLSKGAIYIEDKSESTPIPKNAVLIDQKVTVEGDKVHTDSYYAVPTVTTETTTHTIKTPPKYDGIGPTEYGIPVGLRTGVKEEHASDWYKTMYKSLHRVRFPNDASQNQTVHLGGYMSEPEFDRNEKLKAKYATTDHRRKPEKSISYTKEHAVSPEKPKQVSLDTTVVRHEPKREVYRVEPRSIADYEPGRSSLAEKEFQKHEYLGGSSKPQQGLNRRWPNVLLSDGYESDSTLIRKTGRNLEVDPEQQKSWYKEIQKGGEIPLTGLRKSAPEKPAESHIKAVYRPLYESQPPNNNHKHVPNVSYHVKSTVYTAKPFYLTHFDHTCVAMSCKRNPPEPPKRHSSKRSPALTCQNFAQSGSLKNMQMRSSLHSSKENFQICSFPRSSTDSFGKSNDSLSLENCIHSISDTSDHFRNNYNSLNSSMNKLAQYHNFRLRELKDTENTFHKNYETERSKNAEIHSNAHNEHEIVCPTLVTLNSSEENVHRYSLGRKSEMNSVSRHSIPGTEINQLVSKDCQTGSTLEKPLNLNTNPFRMITILPSIRPLISPVNSVKSQTVHSIAQNNKKLHCNHLSDINPLKCFLRKYGKLLPKMDDSAPNYLSTVKLLLKSHHKSTTDFSNVNNNGNTWNSRKPFKRIDNLNMNATTYKNPETMPLSTLSLPNKILNYPDSCKFNCNVTTEVMKTPSIYKKSNVVAGSVHGHCRRSNANLILNEKNSILYHKYVADMMFSASRSKNFIRLRKFFSSLEQSSSVFLSGKNDAQKMSVRYSATSYQKMHFWHKSQDRSLKCKSLSVSDLKQIFQGTATNGITETCGSSFCMSFQFKRLMCVASVSNLVKKYDSMQSLDMAGTSCHYNCHKLQYCQCKIEAQTTSKTTDFKETKLPVLPFGWNCSLQGKNLSMRYTDNDGHSTECDSNYNHFSNPSINSSVNEDGVMNEVQRKVKFFETASKRSLHKSRLRNISNNKKLSRNLSYCDLRTAVDGDKSIHYSSPFSSHYIPERAMSCLDLSHESLEIPETENRAVYDDSLPSRCSFYSIEGEMKYCDIRTTHVIKTGTVAQIKNKLEKSLVLKNDKSHSLGGSSLSRWSSVPESVSSSDSAIKYNRKGSSLPKVKVSLSKYSSNSVQNLIKKFEPLSTTDNILKMNQIKANSRNRLQGNSFPKTKSNSSFLRNNLNLKMTIDNFSYQNNDVSSMNIFPTTSSDNLNYLDIKYSPWNFASLHQMNRCCNSLEDSDIWDTLSENSTSPTLNTRLQENIGFSAQTYSRLSPEWNHEKMLHIQDNIHSNDVFQKKFSSGTQVIRMYRPLSDFMEKMKKLPLIKVQNSTPKPYVRLESCNDSLDFQSASPHQYQETEVNIHFRSPIRHLEKEYIEEEELRKRQEDAMRKLYEEEKRKKQLQELAEIEMRRHSDFFTPSQKSPIPLNRYDNPFDSAYNRLAPSGFLKGPPPKTMARALYPFTAQTTRELSLSKGDIVYINKQIDRNWFEGEHHGLIGIFPVTYVEIIPNEKANLQPRKATEGEAIVRYNFRAQTPIELSLFKGEKVILTKRTDRNWYEGRLGTKKGIFPVSYVEVLQEPGEFSGPRTLSPKPPASPVYSPLINGSPPKSYEGPTFNTGIRPNQDKPPLQLDKLENKSSLTQTLHIDTYNEPIPYRSLYSYKPQNDDELELKEGDTVYVMEKCDDGWYVGTSLRTGLFGTFPGNYVERI